jgi:7-keto-8-aminopelargonate synthetase-like enzyme
MSRIARVYGYRPSGRRRYAYFTDEFNHISIREGIQMSGAVKIPYRHCDMNHLEDQLKTSDATCKLIVSDGVFSQDGDIAPLPQILGLAERYDAMVYIDDAHATGVLGATGGGTTEYFKVASPRLICMGTLSKAYGAIGGFIATEKYICDILRFGCSAYGFTSTLPPDQAFAVSEAMDMVIDEPQRRQRLAAGAITCFMASTAISRVTTSGMRGKSMAESNSTFVLLSQPHSCHTLPSARSTGVSLIPSR